MSTAHRGNMTEILTESFCERCGSRYTFESAVPKNRLRKVKVLSRGLKNFVLDDKTSIDEAMASARSDTDRAVTSSQLDAFHNTFNFCMQCRQYTCPNCWNDADGRCLTCAPLGHDLAPAPFSALSPATAFPTMPPAPDAAPPATATNGHALADDANGFDAIARLDALSWAAAAPPAPEPVVEAVIAEPVVEAVIAEPVVETVIAEPAVEIAPEPVVEAIVAEPVVVIAPEPVVEIAPEPVVEAIVAEPVVEIAPEPVVEIAPEPVVEAVVAEPVVENALPTPVVEPLVDHLADPAFIAATDDPVIDDDAISDHDVAIAAAAAAAAVIAPASEPISWPEPEPIVVEIVEPEPVAAAPEPVAAAPEIVEPEPVAAAPEPVAPEPIAAAPEPIAAAPEPIAVAPEPIAVAPEPIAVAPEPIAVAPEPIAVAPEPIAVAPEPIAVAPEPIAVAPEPIAAAPEPVDIVEQPTWSIVAPDPSAPVPTSEPTVTPPAIHATNGASSPVAPPSATEWPDQPEWPAQQASAGLPFLGRPVVPTGGVEALWAASDQAVTASPNGTDKTTTGVQSCVSCGLSLSASARFCRRCGTAQH